MPVKRGHGNTGLLHIVEGKDNVTHCLPGLVPLARQDHHVAAAGPLEGPDFDRRVPQRVETRLRRMPRTGQRVLRQRGQWTALRLDAVEAGPSPS